VPSGGTQSDQLNKDMITTIENRLFPAVTTLLQEYGRLGQQHQDQPGAAQRSETWARPAFQVKEACDELVQMISRGQGVSPIAQLRLPEVIQQQPGGEQYSAQ
jgi:hypothetical protein